MGLAEAIVGAGASIGSGFLSNYFAKKAASSQASRNWYYYKKQKELDFDYDENQYYNLARRYQENSAKWQIEGMKRAGVNPILAYGSLGDVNSMQGSSANSNWSSQSSPSFDISESIRDLSDAGNLASSQKDKELSNDVKEKTLKALKKKPELENAILAAQKDLISKQSEAAVTSSAKNKADADKSRAEASYTAWREAKERATTAPNPLYLLGRGINAFERYTRSGLDLASEWIGKQVGEGKVSSSFNNVKHFVGGAAGRATQTASDLITNARNSLSISRDKFINLFRSRARDEVPNRKDNNNPAFHANPIMMFH